MLIFQRKKSKFLTQKEELKRLIIPNGDLNFSLIKKEEIRKVLEVSLPRHFSCKGKFISNEETAPFIADITLFKFFPFIRVKKYYFVIIFIPSVIPSRCFAWRCYLFNNQKIISLLGYERLIELEGYLAAKKIEEFFYGARSNNLLPVILNDWQYHPIIICNNYNLSQKPKILGEKETSIKKLLEKEKVKEVRKYLKTIFIGENQEINLGWLMNEVDRYENPGREP